MPKRLYPETMIGEAQKAERISALEADPTAKHNWYKIALTWRALAEQAWVDLGPPARAQAHAQAQRVRGAPWRT